MPQLVLHLLGAPRVQIDNEPVTVRRRKALALLVVACLEQRTLSRDTLATMLWPDYSQGGARTHLRRALNSLRRVVGYEWLAVDRNTITLASDVEIWSDAGSFHSLITSCRTHGHAHDQLCPLCVGYLEEAAALYHDDFLAGFTLPDAPDFDDWQRRQAELLRTECIALLDRLSYAYAAQGEYDLAIARALRRLHFDLTHEPTHRLLMRLYAAINQPLAALRQYDRCVECLRSELGVAPEVETTELVTLINLRRFHPASHDGSWFDGDSLQPLPAGWRSYPTDLSGTHDLPAQTTPFVGRLVELHAVADLFADPARRLITILGPGGIGKTRLALHLCEMLLGQGQQDICFVPLTHLGDVDQLVPVIAGELGLLFHAGGRSPKQQLLDFLKGRRLMLVLDNFEHLLPAVSLIQEMLSTSPTLRILVTSRERLQLMGESVFTLGSMDYPTWETPQDAQEYSAVQLFLQTARRIRPDWESDGTDLQYVARICRLVGGMPLGIILAAAWIAVLSPQEIAAELTRGFDLLETQLHDVPERQRSMRAVLAYSWSRLEQCERDAFMRLAVFRGTFRRDAAEAITGATPSILSRLVSKSFVHLRFDGRYEMHELLRQYGIDQLEENGAAVCARDAHSAYWLGWLQRAESSLAGGDQFRIITELESDFENIRAAWEWAVRTGNYERANQALDGLFEWFWLRRARQQDGLALLRYALDTWTPERNTRPHSVWWRIATRNVEQQLGPWLTVFDRTAVERALAEAKRRNDAHEMAFCSWMLGLVQVSEHHATGSASELLPAIECYQDSVAGFRALDDRFYLAQALESLGHCHRLLNQPKAAIDCLEESLRIRRQSDDRFGMARSLRELGFATWLQGLEHDTESAWQEAHAIQQSLNEKQGIADTRFFLSVLSLNLGDWQRAQSMAKEVAEISKEIGNQFYQAWAGRALAIAEAMQNDATRSQRQRCAPFHTVTPFSARLFFALFADFPTSFVFQLRQLWELARSDEEIAVCLCLSSRLFAETGAPEQATVYLSTAICERCVAVGWIGLLPEMKNLRRLLRSVLPESTFDKAWNHGQHTALCRVAEHARNLLQAR